MLGTWGQNCPRVTTSASAPLGIAAAGCLPPPCSCCPSSPAGYSCSAALVPGPGHAHAQVNWGTSHCRVSFGPLAIIIQYCGRGFEPW